MMENSNFGGGVSLAGADHVFGEKKIPEALTLSSRGSLDKRSKNASPAPSQPSALVLKKLPKGIKISATPRESVVVHSKVAAQPDSKVTPLRLLKSRKVGGAASALAMRHPSPRTLGSFVASTNISGSNAVELSKLEGGAGAGGGNTAKKVVSAVEKHKVQLKRASESQKSLHSKAPPGQDHIKAVLNVSKTKKPSQQKPTSPPSIDITAADSKRRLERVKSAAKIASPSAKLSETATSNKPSVKGRIVSAAQSPRSSTSHGNYAAAQKPLFSPSKCIPFLFVRVILGNL